MTRGSIKVLIVEDDPFLQSMYANKLESEGFKVYLAEDGKKGLRLAQIEKPMIILLDIILPEADGYEVLKTLKANVETKDIPVILLTNLSQRSDVEQGISLGAAAYLIKAHFMPSEVVAKIKEILGISEELSK
jgi:DNA-binding response OmpR family regulator